MADDFILNTLGFKTGAKAHSDEIPELQAIDNRLDAHTAQRNSEGLITKGINAVLKTVWNADDQSEKKLQELRAQVLADLQANNKTAVSALDPDIQKAVKADIEACQGDSVRNGAASFVASTTVAASMFVRGPRGRALSMTLNAANDIHTQDGTAGIIADATLGAAKGYVLSRTYESLGAKQMSAPMKGVAIGMASRVEENVLTASNYRDQNGNLDIGAGVNNTLHETFNPLNTVIDAGTFGFGHVAASGVNATFKGALEKNPIAANVFTGFSIGLVSGMNSEFAQETSNPNGSVNYFRVGWKGLESGLSNSISAFGGAKLEQTSIFAPGADLRQPGSKPAGTMMLPDATDADARKTAPLPRMAPATPTTASPEVAPPASTTKAVAETGSVGYADLISSYLGRPAPAVVNPVESTGGTGEPIPVVPVAGEGTVLPFNARTAGSAPHTDAELHGRSSTGVDAGDAHPILHLTDDALVAAAGRNDDPLRAANPRSNDEIRIGSQSDVRFLGTDSSGTQAIVEYDSKRTLATTGPVVSGTIESNGFKRIATAIPVEVNGTETDLPLYTKDGKSRIYAAVPTADGSGFTERVVRGIALRDMTDLGTTDLANAPTGRTDAWRNAQFLRGVEIAGTDLEVIGHDADGNDLVVRDKTKTAGSNPAEVVDDLNHYRPVVVYDEHNNPAVLYTPKGSNSGELYRMDPDFDNGHYRAVLQDDVKLMSRAEAGQTPLVDAPAPPPGAATAHAVNVMQGIWQTVDNPSATSVAAFTALIEHSSGQIDYKTLRAEIEASGRSEDSRRAAEVLLTKAYKAIGDQGVQKITDAFKPGADAQARLDFQIWALHHGPDALDLVASKISDISVQFAQDNPHAGPRDYGPQSLLRDSVALMDAGRYVMDAARTNPDPNAEGNLERFVHGRYWGVTVDAVAAGASRPAVGPNADFNSLRQPLIDFANSLNNGVTDPAVASRVINQAFDRAGTSIGEYLLDRSVAPSAPPLAEAQLVHFLSLQPENVRDAVRALDRRTVDGVPLTGRIDHLVDQADPARIQEAQRLLQNAIAPTATAADIEAFSHLVQADGRYLRTPLEQFSRTQFEGPARAAAQDLINESWHPIDQQAGLLLQRAASPKGTIDDHLAFMDFVHQHGPDSLQRLMTDVYTPDETGRNRRQKTQVKDAVNDPDEETKLIQMAMNSRPGVVNEPRQIPTDAELAAMPEAERKRLEATWRNNDFIKEQIRNRAEDVQNLRASLDRAVDNIPGGVWPSDPADVLKELNDPAVRRFMQDVLEQRLHANGSDPDRPTVPVDRDMFDYAATKAGNSHQPDSAYLAIVRAAYGNLNVDVPEVHPKQAAVWETVRRAIAESDPSPARQDELESMLVAQFRNDPLLERRARELEARMYDAPAKATLANALDLVTPKNLLLNPHDFHENFQALSERIGQMSLPEFAEMLTLCDTQGVPEPNSDILFNSPLVQQALTEYRQNSTDPEHQADLQAIQRLLTINYDIPGKEPVVRAVPRTRMQQLANVFAEAQQPKGVTATNAAYANLPENVVALLRQEGIVPERGPSGYGSTPEPKDYTALNSTAQILALPSPEYEAAVKGVNTLIERATLTPPNNAVSSVDVNGLLRLIADHPEWAASMINQYGSRRPGPNNTDWNKQHFELATLLTHEHYADFAQIKEVFDLLEQSRKARAGDPRNGVNGDPATADSLFRSALHDAQQLADLTISTFPDRSAKPTYQEAQNQILRHFEDLAVARNIELVNSGQPALDLQDPAVRATEIENPAAAHFNDCLERFNAVTALMTTLRDAPAFQNRPPGPGGPRQGRGGPRGPGGGNNQGGPGPGGQPPPGGPPRNP